MKWTGPSLDDIATPLAWLFTTLFVLAAIQVGDAGEDDGEDEVIRITETISVTRSRTVTVTESSTTAASSTTSTTTSTSTTTGSNPSTTTSTTSTGNHPADNIVWPFPEARTMSNAPYTELGLWPSGGTPPSFDGMTWKPAVTDSRLGFWQGTLTTPSVSLGGMTVVRDSFSNQPTFGAPNNLCAKARIYLFDDDAFLRFTSAAPADHQHLPWIADPYTTLEYKAYYLGNQETSPNSQCDRPEDEPGGSAFAAVKPEVRTLLEGLRPGESRTKEIACNANFALALACSSWDTTRLYATAVMDQVLPAT